MNSNAKDTYIIHTLEIRQIKIILIMHVVSTRIRARTVHIYIISRMVPSYTYTIIVWYFNWPPAGSRLLSQLSMIPPRFSGWVHLGQVDGKP